MTKLIRPGRLLAMLTVLSLLAGCDDVRVYGSVGTSSYRGGGGYHSRYHGSSPSATSVTVGGRIY